MAVALAHLATTEPPRCWKDGLFGHTGWPAASCRLQRLGQALGSYAGLWGKQVRVGDASEIPFPKSPGSEEVSHKLPRRLGIIEWFGLEGTFKGHLVQPRCNEQGHLQLDQVAQSPLQPDLMFPGMGHLQPPWATCLCSTIPIVIHFFLTSSLNPPSFSLKPLPLVLSLQALLRILKGCNKVSPEPYLLRAKQPQLSQPVLIGEMFHPSDHFCGPPLDLLQQVHVLPVLRTPELDAVLQVGSHHSRAEGQNHLPQPAGHTSFDAAQDTVGFLGRECTLLAHVHNPQVLLHRAALNPFIPQPVLIPGVAPTQVQDLALALVEPHEIHMGPLLELVQVPLNGIPFLRHVNHTTQLGVICKLAEGTLNPTVHVIDEDIKQYWSQYRPLRDITCPSTTQEVWEERLPVKTEEKKLLSTSAFSLSIVTSLPVKPFLLFFASLAKCSSSHALAFLTPSLHNRATSLYSSQDTFPSFHCLCISFLPFIGLDSYMLVSCHPFLISYTRGSRALARYGKRP
ncbi:hypothetical protein QYF61_025838 [Mycteria americana]|uniref:Uncharacterized protein n=1 Tax=Mycteria americana TaxID=33587 RepID=A0AAN7RZY6_MYCAM|nr:hypothetical protein QYF61_025838 [Mycteria americana]